ncbi:unnamed protein product [Lepeophtheirus salmonis]|uniref:(salmon louse) hypothetical protein n=1 Tax=Lepeophtheirus salmonis TaxID=72036 RepID=A0A7R8D2N0_LEPSM|nr:unnamed protein product [Lepeophtheirus salmonis]CAF3006851.1 unnamed protein product [Lepeophtheirus salmonis]
MQDGKSILPSKLLKAPNSKNGNTNKHAYTICVNDLEVMTTKLNTRKKTERFLLGFHMKHTYVCVYYWMEALLFASLLIYCVAQSSEPSKYLIYLSHWNQVLAAIYYLAKAARHTHHWRYSNILVLIRNANASTSFFRYHHVLKRPFSWMNGDGSFGKCGRNFETHGNLLYIYVFVDWRMPSRTILCSLISGLCLIITHFYFSAIDKLKNKLLDAKHTLRVQRQDSETVEDPVGDPV